MSAPARTAGLRRERLQRAVLLAVLLVLALGGFLGVRNQQAPPGFPSAPPLQPGACVRSSFFAVGDTGESGTLRRGQTRVAEALAWADDQVPSQGLVLLGDNFYPDGLEERDATRRVRENLVEPYCRFVALAPAWPGPACAEAAKADGTQDRTLWAVLGNHDHNAPESPRLEREFVPTLISNWKMPAGAAGVYELGGGLALVAYDSTQLMRSGDVLPLQEAARSARGPWRVVVGHHPLRMDWKEGSERAAADALRRGLAASGVEIQLALAGHEHNLQAIDLEEPNLGVLAIAGAGANHRDTDGAVEDRVAAAAGLGFLRVDLLEPGTPAGEGHLRVTLFSVPRWRWPGSAPARPEAMFDLDVRGHVQRLVPEVESDYRTLLPERRCVLAPPA